MLFTALCIIAGLLMTGLCLYGWGSWIMSPEHFRPLPHGPDQYALSKLIALRIYETISAVGMLVMIYVLLIKPWRGGEGLTLYGKLFIGYTLAFFIDVGINYYEYTFAWNTHALNMGVWLPWVPGHKFNHRYAESLVWCWPQYAYFSVALSALIAWGVKVLEVHGIKLLPAMSLLFCVCFVFDIIWEQIMVRWELYAFPRGFSWFTLFAGTQFQHPLNNSISVALYPIPVALLIRAEWAGRNFLDRGLATIAGPSSSLMRTLLSLLAVIGLCSASLILFFHGPWALISLVTDVNLSVTDLPSYLRYE